MITKMTKAEIKAMQEESGNKLTKRYQAIKELEKIVKSNIQLIQEEMDTRLVAQLHTSQIRLEKQHRVTNSYDVEVLELLSLEDIKKATKVSSSITKLVPDEVLATYRTSKVTTAWTIKAIK